MDSFNAYDVNVGSNTFDTKAQHDATDVHARVLLVNVLSRPPAGKQQSKIGQNCGRIVISGCALVPVAIGLNDCRDGVNSTACRGWLEDIVLYSSKLREIRSLWITRGPMFPNAVLSPERMVPPESNVPLTVSKKVPSTIRVDDENLTGRDKSSHLSQAFESTVGRWRGIKGTRQDGRNSRFGGGGPAKPGSRQGKLCVCTD